ncbi:hypothetical protein ACFL15_00750 [Patescibacteria group bacterium]
MKKIITVVLPILLVTVLLFLPIFVKPEILLERGNDLEEFFWPIIYFIKKQILTNHELPLWNNQILGGTPLLPDPQSQLFYLPNLIFLMLPIDLGFIVSLFLHIFLAGIGMYLCAKNGFKFSKYTSIFTAIIYITTPKFAGYLEAGHYGLVCLMTWIPFLLLSLIKITEEINTNWSILFAVSLAGCFYTHSLSFVIAAIASTIFFIYRFIEKKLDVKNLLLFILAVVFTFGLIAISFLPQISWQGQTTRYLLLEKPDVYPKWNSVFEPLKVIFTPWRDIYNVNPEKWITFGIFPLLFAIFGFFKIKRNKKLSLILILIPIFLITLNNASPVHSFLINQNWYKILRVSTRLWFIPIVIVSYLAGNLFEKLSKGKLKFGFLTLLAFLAIAESIALSWTYLKKPINKNSNLASMEVYKYLSEDKERFRVFCLNRCLSQKEAAIYNLELLDGYSTLQQNNFYKQSWQFVQSYWDYYSLSFPPMGLYLFEEIKPHAESLGNYNVKYVISIYKISDSNFEFIKKIDRYYIYGNKLFLPRAYFWTEDQKPSQKLEITIYKPNHIQIKVPFLKERHISLSDVYSPGWKTFLNGKIETNVLERPNGLRVINIEENTNLIDMYYKPKTYTYGVITTIINLFIIIICLIRKKIKTNQTKYNESFTKKLFSKTIITISLLISFLSIYYLFRVIRINSPLELREGGVLSSTYLLSKGLNPYSLKYMPGYTNVYGILYNIICLPLVKSIGLNFSSHRIVSSLFIVLTSYLILKTLQKNKVSFAISLAGTSILFTEISSKGYEVLARPDSLGLFLFLFSILLPYWNNYSLQSVLTGIILGVFAFLAKPYFVIGILYLITYIFIFKSKKKGILLAAISAIILFLCLFLLNIFYETYLINTVFGHLESAGNDKFHLIKQIQTFLMWNFSFIFLEIFALIKFVLAILKKRKRLLIKIDILLYSLLISTLLVIFKMGLHNGNYMTYFTQLITPFLIIDSLKRLDLIKNVIAKNITYVLLIVNILFWFYQIVFSNLTLTTNKIYWQKWENILTNYSSIYNSPLITHYLLDINAEIFDNGQTTFYSSGLVLNSTFNPNLPSWKYYQEYKNRIKENIANGSFDLITVTKNDYNYFNKKDLLTNYEFKETISVSLFNDFWPTEIWVNK